MPTKWEITRRKFQKSIIAAAIKEFGANGYTRGKLSEIARMAGSSPSLVSKYYKTKEQLFNYLLERFSTFDAFAGKEKAQLDIIEAFDIYCNYVKKTLQERPNVFRLWYGASVNRDFPKSAVAEAGKRFEKSPLREIIRHAQQEGEVIGDKPWDVFVSFFCQMMYILESNLKLGTELPGNSVLFNMLQTRCYEIQMRRLKAQLESPDGETAEESGFSTAFSEEVEALKEIIKEKQAENERTIAELERERAQMNGLLTMSHAARWYGTYDEAADRLIPVYSRELRQILGFTDENDFPNDPDCWGGLIHPADEPAMRRELEIALHGGGTKTLFENEYRIRMKNGIYHWFRDTACYRYDADGKMIDCIGLLSDVNEKYEKKALEEKEKQLVKSMHQLFDHIPGMAFVKEAATGKYLVCNETYAAYLSRSMDDVIGCTDKDLFPPEVAEQFVIDDRRALEQRGARVFYETVPGPDGREIHFQTTKLRYIDSMGRECVLGMALDLTALVDSNRKLEDKQAELEKALAKATESSKAKTDFLFNMSHDIRTPMNAIIGFAMLARRNSGNREMLLDCLGKVEDAGNHLLQFINDVLEMAKIESGNFSIEALPVNISEVPKSVDDMIGPLAEAKGLTYKRQFAKMPKNLIIYIDRLRVDQIMINILTNAVKYTPRGGEVTLKTELIPASDDRHIKLRWTVADTGIGMSKEFLAKIYEHFTRAQSSTLSGIQGAGLGMAVVHRLVELMGGTINIERELGVGTTVSVEMEFLKGGEADLEADGEDALDAGGLKVLLVEDNELNQEIAVELMKSMGVSVEVAGDGILAVKRLSEAKKGTFDAVVMDIQMPNMNGYRATEEIRRLKNKASAELPVIAMTANVFEDDRRKAEEAGMNGFLAKPIDVAELQRALASVKRAMNGKKSGAKTKAKK